MATVPTNNKQKKKGNKTKTKRRGFPFLVAKIRQRSAIETTIERFFVIKKKRKKQTNKQVHHLAMTEGDAAGAKLKRENAPRGGVHDDATLIDDDDGGE